VQPASFAKLRRSGVAGPAHELDRRWRDRRSITLSGRNLYTWSKWTSLDPEPIWVTNQFDKSQQTFTPQLAQFVTSIRLTF
jgi:hypothetical protein